MLVTTDTYHTLIGSGASDERLEAALSSAQSIVEDYLGYELEEGSRTANFEGLCDATVPLPGYFVAELKSVSINGVALSSDGYSLDRYFLTLATAPRRTDKLQVAYTAGLTVDTAPKAIVFAISLIAQALLANVGVGGIGQSVNYGVGGSISLDPSRYYKYFNLVDRYREAA